MIAGSDDRAAVKASADRFADRARDLAILAAELTTDRRLSEIAKQYRSSDGLPELQAKARAATESAAAALSASRQLSDCLDAQAAAMRVRTRFAPEQLQSTLARMREAGQPATEYRPWAAELVAAITALQLDAALALLTSVEEADSPAIRAAPDLARDVAAWQHGDLVAGGRAVDSLLASTRRIPDPAPASSPAQLVVSGADRRRLSVAAAWLTAGRGDQARAAALLEDVLSDAPGDGLVRGELAGLRVRAGQLDQAREDARRAAAEAPDQAIPHLVLGTIAERSAAYNDAREHYDAGCRQLGIAGLLLLGSGATFLQPTGLLQLVRACSLAEFRLDTEALGAVEAALGLGLAGDVQHPDAPAYALRAQLLRRSGGASAEFVSAAVEAGRRYLSDDDLDSAIELLGQASQADVVMPESGWLLADALARRAWPQRAPAPDASLLAAARDWWDSWARRVGQPIGSQSWAYLTRANIEAAAQPVSDAHVWRAMLLVERCLVADQSNGNAWGMSATYLRALGFQALAGESADAGFKVDPANPLVTTVRYSLLADAGRYDEALQMLDRVRDRDVSAASADYAWLLFHVNRAAEAIRYLDEPISSGIGKDQNLIVRVFCYMSTGRPKDALRDLAEIVGLPDSDQNSGYRKAYANAALGNITAAERELQRMAAAPDEMVTECYSRAVAACVYLAKGTLDRARSEINQGLAAALTVADFDNAQYDCMLLLSLLDYRGADVAASAEIVRAAVAANRDSLAAHDAEHELSRAHAAHHADRQDSAPVVSLRALEARRLGQAGELTHAAELYEQLRAGPFEPQATAALVSLLRRELELAISRGELEDVSALFHRLSDLGAQPYPVMDLALAQAEASAGHAGQAIARLRGIDATSLDPQWQGTVDLLVGELALSTGDASVATAAFRSALALGPQQMGPERAAQTEARLGVSLAAQGDTQAAVAHYANALRLWSDVGALDASAALQHEVRAVAGESGRAWLDEHLDATASGLEELATE